MKHSAAERSGELTLAALSPDESAVVGSIGCRGDIRRRLRELGLVEGTTVECVGVSPFGDPAAYLIRGAVVALRHEDSANITCVARAGQN